MGFSITSSFSEGEGSEALSVVTSLMTGPSGSSSSVGVVNEVSSAIVLLELSTETSWVDAVSTTVVSTLGAVSTFAEASTAGVSLSSFSDSGSSSSVFFEFAGLSAFEP